MISLWHERLSWLVLGFGAGFLASTLIWVKLLH